MIVASYLRKMLYFSYSNNLYNLFIIWDWTANKNFISNKNSSFSPNVHRKVYLAYKSIS